MTETVNIDDAEAHLSQLAPRRSRRGHHHRTRRQAADMLETMSDQALAEWE